MPNFSAPHPSSVWAEAAIVIIPAAIAIRCIARMRNPLFPGEKLYTAGLKTA
jgi:hypothetical protein